MKRQDFNYFHESIGAIIKNAIIYANIVFNISVYKSYAPPVPIDDDVK